jgi:hypothetical protein
MAKFKGLTFVVVGLILTGVVVYVLNSGKSVEDFRVLTVDDSGIVLRSVSWERKMTNELRVKADVRVWVPKGMGWYRSDKIKKLLFQQNKQSLADDLSFYNFGFIPDVVVFGSDTNWIYNPDVIKKWGVVNYLRYLVNNEKLMVKDETVNGDLIKESDFLNNVIQRDLADSRLLKEDLRLIVYNQGQSNGLAGFISRILEWSGFTVVGVENSGGDIDGCQVNFGSKSSVTYGLNIIRKEFPECKFIESGDIGEMEVELYFGDKYSQMLNYQSYYSL